MFGSIKHFNAEKRFGFIRVSDQPADLFFHASEFKGDEAQLVKGALVEFVVGQFKGKPVARDLRLLASEDDGPPGSAYATQGAVRAVLSGGAV